ncbi:hypothetical protein BCR41DRAFT_362010 [Lobosporangium transversale]|uniref:Uncharacterized protein n=1 Tax=Lobosporangium transversale TaxID=64571 RepID=A0A1Y2G9X9_9FUNG|nr:hypothetical protein BCR41DRAFT_362010 [Lobosporangium transversale]ORZ05151.1 hypothetical protein BCR41DRAFT_362010 [Lobosporangium transversale]|eukprot:XP_021876926.1 hypothetical protein BCR41DRAFT_362010 [Lobosporangium transversale]
MDINSSFDNRASPFGHTGPDTGFEYHHLTSGSDRILEPCTTVEAQSSFMIREEQDEAGHISYDNSDSPAIPSRPGSPVSSLNSPSSSEVMKAFISTPPPLPAFTDPPSPPRRGSSKRREWPLSWDCLSEGIGAENRPSHFGCTCQDRSIYPSQPHLSYSTSLSQTHHHHIFEFEQQPRKPLTSITGFNRCLWPPNSTFLTMSNATLDEQGLFPQLRTKEQQWPRADTNEPQGSFTRLATSPLESNMWHESLGMGIKGSKEGFTENMQELQPCRKSRRMVDGPYHNERNNRMVVAHVRRLIQEAVEDGVGELDLSNLELTDLPSEIRDLNFAIVYNERGSFSLSTNRLKLFLSSNLFTTIPMDVFALHNLSVLSIRNNSIESIPPEIGLLHNLVELSIGGNLLKKIPSQIALLPKLLILTVHPNPFLIPPAPKTDNNHTDTSQFHDNQVNLAALRPPHQMLLAERWIPTSPLGSPTMDQSGDINMLPMMPEQLTLTPNSLSPVITDSEMEGTLATTEVSIQGTGSASMVTSETRLNGERLDDSTASRGIKQLPPHIVTRSRFPTLLTLAGNALLDYLDSHDSRDIASRNENTVDRPRKDSKMSLDEDEQDRKCNVPDEELSKLNRAGSEPSYGEKKRYVVKDEVIKSYLTLYLFEHFKRARSNNRCAGCQRKFWKPCRIMVVWQELLGQTQVPIEWKGCGIGRCLGVPMSVWTIIGQTRPSTEVEAAVVTEPPPPT